MSPCRATLRASSPWSAACRNSSARPDARSWQNAALSQLLNQRPPRPLTRELALDCQVWHRRRFGEIDDSLIVDVLERAAIIAGARLVVERHLYARLDPDTPRVVVRLASLDSSAGSDREGA